MTTWTVTLKTGRNTWSIIEVEAADHIDAVRVARRLLGNHPVSEVV